MTVVHYAGLLSVCTETTARTGWPFLITCLKVFRYIGFLVGQEGIFFNLCSVGRDHMQAPAIISIRGGSAKSKANKIQVIEITYYM